MYGTTSWMAISSLSETSIAVGEKVKLIPGFTHGKWIQREPVNVQNFSKGKDSLKQEKRLRRSAYGGRAEQIRFS